jgi:hypothetical protein
MANTSQSWESMKRAQRAGAITRAVLGLTAKLRHLEKKVCKNKTLQKNSAESKPPS